jgi:glutamyl-Q tRNA(Asp) synthetase
VTATTRPVLRFAPSPNGWLHLGHALSALTVEAHARALGGRFLLRIEDIDPTRARPDHIAGVFEHLAWLGLVWEEPVLRQSQHFDRYRAAAARLDAMGLLYPCFATRSEIIEAADPNICDPDGSPIYPGLHKGLTPAEIDRRKTADEPFVLRLDMARAIEHAREKLAGAPLAFTELSDDPAGRAVAADPARWGDVVIVRKEAPTSYHLSVVVDDHYQGITHVTRGRDLYAATDVHRLLQVLLDLPPPLYYHHPLYADPQGRKLSKSAGDTSLATLRAEGWTAADVRTAVAGLLPRFA